MSGRRTGPLPLPQLGQRIRQLRKAAGKTQLDLAVAAGLHSTTLAQLEYGVHPDPRIRTVVAIARALGVGLDELIGEPIPSTNREQKKK